MEKRITHEQMLLDSWNKGLCTPGLCCIFLLKFQKIPIGTTQKKTTMIRTIFSFGIFGLALHQRVPHFGNRTSDCIEILPCGMYVKYTY
jgi:hypothetical protein